jgi:F0F1-type ATP synthase assembly protein I
LDADEPGSSPPQRPRKQPTDFLRDLALAMELPFIPVAAVVIGGGLGYLLDGRAHTSPVFTIVLGLLGFLAGIREILRRLSRRGKQDGK